MNLFFSKKNQKNSLKGLLSRNSDDGEDGKGDEDGGSHCEFDLALGLLCEDGVMKGRLYTTVRGWRDELLIIGRCVRWV